MISAQRPMVAKCIMKDKQNWMFDTDSQQRRSMTFAGCQSEKSSGIRKPNGEEWEQACF